MIKVVAPFKAVIKGLKRCTYSMLASQNVWAQQGSNLRPRSYELPATNH